MSARAYIYSGGISHPFGPAADALVSMLRQAGIEAQVGVDLEALAPRLERDPGALLIVHALRWTMTQHEKYEPDRAAWAYSPSERVRSIIVSHVAKGGGLLGLHTASICFDDWPQWGELLGGRWEWNVSRHPPLGPVQLSLAADSTLGHGLAGCTLQDEAYCKLRIESASTVFGWVSAADGEGSTGLQPACWSRRYGEGRAVYLSPGHDAASLSQPQFSRLIRRSALWASGKSDSAVEAA